MSRTAIVTGGNSGIGYATAEALKAKGYEVTIVGRNEVKVGEAAKSLDVHSIVADLSTQEGVQKVIDAFEGKPLDVLVNNAAIADFVPIDHRTQEDFTRIMDTNVRSVYFLTKGLLPSLRQTRGAITTVSSAIVTSGVPAATAYAASKGAIDAWTRSLALELATQGVRVNAVAPGAIDTPIMDKYGFPEEIIPALKEQAIAGIPMGRFGLASEVASVIVAQLEAAYVTGSVWAVDGGIGAK